MGLFLTEETCRQAELERCRVRDRRLAQHRRQMAERWPIMTIVRMLVMRTMVRKMAMVTVIMTMMVRMMLKSMS